jgi:O-antigen ligase
VYLQAVVEGGLPLLFATLALLLAPLFVMTPFVRRNAALAATYAAVCGFVIHGLVDDLWFFPKVATMWCLFIGVAAASVDALRPNRPTIAMNPSTFANVRLRVRNVVPELEPALAAHDGKLA